MGKPRKHLVIPDVQIKPHQSLDHLDWFGQYAVEKLPDEIIIIGDWADMPSLCLYDKGKKGFEGRTYKDDIEAANEGLRRFMAPISAEIIRRDRGHLKRWNPGLTVTLGNHEHRVPRAVELQRELEGLISISDLKFAEHGFKVVPFLEPVVIDGIAYCHYFCSGQMGHPISSARALLTKMHMSCVAGHQQGKDIAYSRRADGSLLTAVICGSSYPEDQEYLNAQTNKHWRGLLLCQEVENGSFDEAWATLRFLQDRYGAQKG